MANPNPLNQFKPGISGNPSGRPALPEEIKEARKINKIEFERVLNEMIYMNLSELKSRADNPETPVVELLVAKILAEGIKRGDEKRLGFILDRLIGPVKTKVALEGGDENAPPIRTAHGYTVEEMAEIVRIARGAK